ncbi:uncharacterized protein LOC114190767 [Vigna unguiculata]|uniref:uncharacterized protein LOC114190767 n=1 Tax=Vigna unguiculata TaxID=3917 RepID=UPI0010170255|nr:uncharacterized protein LOC114190767 [Vigna unguiculata]
MVYQFVWFTSFVWFARLCLYVVMARKLDLIKDIDDKKETLKLAVRVKDLWFVQNRDNSRHMEMILLDHKGDMIAAMVRKEDLCLWEEKVVEGQTYIMHNFKILKNQGQFRVCEHPYKLLFIGATTIKQQPISSIPLNVYNFKSIEDIVDGNYSADLVYDIIGVVDNVRCNPQSKNVVFHIRDMSSAVIGCTLWDSYYFKFMSNWRGEPDSYLLVVLLTQAKIKPCSGRWPVSISNSWNGSKLFMGEECAELVRFREQWIERFGNEVNPSQECSQLSSPSQYSEHEKFMYKAVVRTISEITCMKEEQYCVTVANTVKFNLGNDGWCYPVCNSCRKKTDEVGPFKCILCGFDNEKHGIRYKLELQVTDGNSYTNFVMWDQDCTNLIGVSALELMNKMIEVDGEDDPKCFPEDLDALLGCTLAFKVRVQPSNRSSSVMKASTNPETIASIRSKLDPKMIKDNSAEGTSDSSHEANSKEGPEIEEDKSSKATDICVWNNQPKTAKESRPKAICAPNTQSPASALNISGRHTKNIEESSRTPVLVSTKEPKSSDGSTNKSKSGGSSKSACHTGKNKEILEQAGFERNTEADMCTLTLSGSADHDPYIDFCVTPTKELLFDFEVDCDHLDDIPSAEFSRSKTKKRMKQEKL